MFDKIVTNTYQEMLQLLLAILLHLLRRNPDQPSLSFSFFTELTNLLTDQSVL